MRFIFPAARGGNCRSLPPEKFTSKPSADGTSVESGLLASTYYEKTYPVNPGNTGLHHASFLLYDRCERARGCDHDDAHRNRCGARTNQHQHDSDPAKYGRLLSWKFELIGKGDAQASPFLWGRPKGSHLSEPSGRRRTTTRKMRATRLPLHFDFDFFFFRFLANDRGDRPQLLRTSQVH